MDLAAELVRFGPGAAARPISGEEARAYCRGLAETHYENFTVASRLAPRHLRQHLCNVYAYCRWADDLADEVIDSSPGHPLRGSAPREECISRSEMSTMLLDWWEGELDAAY